MTPIDYSSIKATQLWKLGSIKLGTPVAPIEWAHIGTPQTGNPEYDGEFGRYRFDLILDPKNPEHAAFITKLTKAHASLIEKAQEWAKETKAKIKFSEEVNLKPQTIGKGADKKETGLLKLQFKRDAAHINKDGALVKTPMSVVDVQGSEVPKLVLDTIGNGTEVRVAFELSAYSMNGSLGTTAKYRKAQLTNLVRFGDDVNLGDYFDDDVTGFTVESVSATSNTSAEPDEDVEEEGDF